MTRCTLCAGGRASRSILRSAEVARAGWPSSGGAVGSVRAAEAAGPGRPRGSRPRQEAAFGPCPRPRPRRSPSPSWSRTLCCPMALAQGCRLAGRTRWRRAYLRTTGGAGRLRDRRGSRRRRACAPGWAPAPYRLRLRPLRLIHPQNQFLQHRNLTSLPLKKNSDAVTTEGQNCTFPQLFALLSSIESLFIVFVNCQLV